MTTGIATFLRVYTGTTDIAKYQNYEVNTAVDGYGYVPFDTGSITFSAAGDQNSMQVRFPYTSRLRQRVEQIIKYAWIVEIQIYKFTPTATGNISSTKTLATQFTGQGISGSLGLGAITLELGSSLSPIGAQIPPAIATTTLIGEPCKV
jgi:hypothetical protein